jgi:hypothetical protein
MNKTQRARIRKLAKFLRNPKLKQAKHHLRDWNSVAKCCLGHACELYRKETGRGTWRNGYFILPSGKEDLVLPPEVRDWFGLKRANPIIRVNDRLMLAADHNDEGATLAQIADGFDLLAKESE